MQSMTFVVKHQERIEQFMLTVYVIKHSYRALIARGRHEMSLSERYQNRGHFYIILGQCTETMFCSAYRCYVCH